MDHPERVRLAGTYGARWQRERAPYPPDDYDARFHLLGQSDQWLAGPLHGAEPFVVEHMHPEQPCIESVLPGLAVRCMAAIEGDAAEPRELAMRIDTVRLFPHELRGVVVWRGTIEVREDDADDVAVLLVACERMQAPRPHEHFQTAMRRRLSEQAALTSLDSCDLLPAGMATPLPPGAADMQGTGVMAQRLELRAQDELNATRQGLLDQGIDPDAYGLPTQLAPAEPAPELNDAEVQLDALHAQAEHERDEAEQQARQLCAEQGIDYEGIASQAQQRSARPPTFSAAGALESLQAQLALSENSGVALPSVKALLRNPTGLQAQLREVEAHTVETYCRFAHLGSRPEPEEGEPKRHRGAVERAMQKGKALAGMDLTCADLSEMDLSGADLRGAYLAAACMRGCNLTGARLDDAVLAFADLTGAVMVACAMHRTNLGGAVVVDADLSRSQLEGVTLDGANLTAAKLGQAQLREVTLDGTVLDHAELAGAQLLDIRAIKASWIHAVLTDARVERAQLMGFAAPRAQLDEAEFERYCFVDTNLTDASLRGAVLCRCGFGGTTALDRADMTGARLENLSWARATARAAVLHEAQLDDVDLTKTDLSGATLDGARAVNVIWCRANLRAARLVGLHAPMNIFQRAQLQGADLTGSNCHGADFTRAVVDDATCFANAVLDRAQLTMVREGAP